MSFFRSRTSPQFIRNPSETSISICERAKFSAFPAWLARSVQSLWRGIFGLRASERGTITYLGKKLHITRPKAAIENGIALLTEDRRGSGIFGVLSVADNVSVASLQQYLLFRIMLNDKKIVQLVKDNVKKLSIKTPSIKTPIQSLSGGNQQKVIISRWLANDPTC